MTIVVNTIQAKTRWAAAHIGEEGCVAVSPAVADSDAPASVVRVIPVGKVVAASLHVEPRLVLDSAVFSVSLSVGFADAAAAASRPSFGQAAFVDQDTLSAVAKAPITGAIGDTGVAIGVGAVALPAWWAERHDLEFAEALIDHAPLRGLNGEAVNA